MQLVYVDARELQLLTMFREVDEDGRRAAELELSAAKDDAPASEGANANGGQLLRPTVIK